MAGTAALACSKTMKSWLRTRFVRCILGQWNGGWTTGWSICAFFRWCFFQKHDSCIKWFLQSRVSKEEYLLIFFGRFSPRIEAKKSGMEEAPVVHGYNSSPRDLWGKKGNMTHKIETTLLLKVHMFLHWSILLTSLLDEPHDMSYFDL